MTNESILPYSSLLNKIKINVSLKCFLCYMYNCVKIYTRVLNKAWFREYLNDCYSTHTDTNTHTDRQTHTHTNTHRQTDRQTHTQTHTQTHIDTHTHTHTHKQTHIDTQTHTHTDTHIQAHIHTQTLAFAHLVIIYSLAHSLILSRPTKPH